MGSGMHFPEGDWQVRGWLPRSPQEMPELEVLVQKPVPPLRPTRRPERWARHDFSLPDTEPLPFLLSWRPRVGFFFLKLPQFEPIIWREVSVTTVSVSKCVCGDRLGVLSPSEPPRTQQLRPRPCARSLAARPARIGSPGPGPGSLPLGSPRLSPAGALPPPAFPASRRCRARGTARPPGSRGPAALPPAGTHLKRRGCRRRLPRSC